VRVSKLAIIRLIIYVYVAAHRSIQASSDPVNLYTFSSFAFFGLTTVYILSVIL